MNIETYEVEEKVDSSTGSSPEMEAEAIKLVEELGLEGQKSLVVKVEETDTAERIPYPKLSSKEMAVYRVLFPEQEAARKYKAGIIPVRVLQVIGHAQQLFDEVQIWHDCVVNPDPVLVAKKGTDYYLLARWGRDALKQFADLVVDARKRLTEEWTERCNKRIAECQAWLATLDVHVAEKLSGSWIYEPF